MNLKSIFWVLVLALIFYVGFKVVPIYYKGILGLRTVCKEQADLYHKYGRDSVFRGLDESLESMGIPKNKRESTVTVKENSVVVTITYEDTADFFGKYQKDFTFYHECEGVLRSVF